MITNLTAGDSARWHDDPFVAEDGLRRTSADWALNYRLRGPIALTITAVADGEGWLSLLTTTASATLLAGTYTWAAILTKIDERVTVATGSCEITADLTASDDALDARSVARVALADCERALATFNSTGGKVKKYTIGPRQMEFQTLAELLQLLHYWKLRVRNENVAAAVASGQGNPSTFRVRFT